MRQFLLAAVLLGISATALLARDQVTPKSLPLKFAFGLDKLHWGMSSEDAKNALPGLAVAKETGGIADPDYVGDVIYPYKDCKFRLMFEFQYDHLSNLQMLTEADAGDSCYTQVRTELFDRYGDPSVSTDDTSFIWTVGGTRVWYQYWKNVHPVIDISFG